MLEIMPMNGVSPRLMQFIDPEERHGVGLQEGLELKLNSHICNLCGKWLKVERPVRPNADGKKIKSNGSLCHSKIPPQINHCKQEKTPFQRLARQMRDVLGDGGILKEVVHEGEGPLVPRDASVSIHFSGFLEYSDQPFESTRHFRFPKMMKLGKDMTVWGLDLGLRTMKRGEFSRFLVQHSYAYGEMGCPPLIPPCATVLYEVQVIDYLDSAQVDEFFSLSPKEQNLAPLSMLLNVVDTERSFGNRCFNQSRYDDAKHRYKQAMTLLRNREPADEEERKRVAEMSLPFLLNLSLTYLRLERPQKALQFGQRALEISPGNTKALFRCGQACLEMNDYEKAQDYLTAAQAKKPFDADINNLLRKLANCYKEALDKEKHMCSKMFSALKSEK